MWMKVIAGVSMAGVLAFGAALVSKAKSPVLTGSTSDAGGSSEAKFAVISHGETVAVSQHLDPGGGFTVFLFGANW